MGDWRLPAEWEPQDGVLLAWPHEGTDWAPILGEVEQTYVALVVALARFTRALVICADPALEARARRLLEAADARLDRTRFLRAPYDDTWLRDSGPITLADGAQRRLLDFRFTGWGGKFEASRDDRLVERLCAGGWFGRHPRQRIDWALEGGAIDADGAGTVLTTWQCLHQRHPRLSRGEMVETLASHLHAERVLMLERGWLQGDDTDAHIDTLARFAPGGRIVWQDCDLAGDVHHAELRAMGAELATLRTTDGRPYALDALPWARPIHDADGRRLAASYANFLVTDGAVLMPAYGDPADGAALAVLAAAFPGRQAVAVPCRPLIEQNGSLHCITMQLPRGVLNDVQDAARRAAPGA
jgi:agmatine/peptidylarginine deiminase